MTYAFIQDVPIDTTAYGEIRAGLGDQPPDGLVVHLVVPNGAGLRYIDVWESEQHWRRFHDARLHPLVDEAIEALLARGGTIDPALLSFEALELLDVWRGTPVPLPT